MQILIDYFAKNGPDKFAALLFTLSKQLGVEGRPVFANYHIAGINCPKIIRGARPDDYNILFGGYNDPQKISKDYYLNYSQYYLPDPEVLIMKTRSNAFPRNSLVILDEAYAWGLDARESVAGVTESKKSRLALTHAILQSRKAHFNIEHTEQLIKSIDNRLRFLTEIYVLMEGISHRIIDGEKVNVEFRLSPFQNLGVWGFRQLPPLYVREPVFWALNSCYDTYEQIELEQAVIEDAQDHAIKRTRTHKAEVTEEDRQADAEGGTFTL